MKGEGEKEKKKKGAHISSIMYLTFLLYRRKCEKEEGRGEKRKKKRDK